MDRLGLFTGRQEKVQVMISFIRRSSILLCALAFLLERGPAVAQQSLLVLPRGSSTIVLEPYAPNILRVTLSLQHDAALRGASGRGPIGLEQSLR